MALSVVGEQEGDEMRAMDLVDRLGFIRRVVGRCPEWLVDYEARDIPEAMRACEADLSPIDPLWMKVLDFRALPGSRTWNRRFWRPVIRKIMAL